MNKVFLFVEIDVKPGQGEAFLLELHKHVEIIRGEEGCESIEVLKNELQENLIHVWEIWSDKPAWDRHMVNDASKAWQIRASEFVASEKITVMSKP
jgi:autoinducer 2-degrading protein